MQMKYIDWNHKIQCSRLPKAQVNPVCFKVDLIAERRAKIVVIQIIKVKQINYPLDRHGK